jgi:hypothetical protein
MPAHWGVSVLAIYVSKSSKYLYIYIYVHVDMGFQKPVGLLCLLGLLLYIIEIYGYNDF